MMSIKKLILKFEGGYNDKNTKSRKYYFHHIFKYIINFYKKLLSIFV